MLRNPAVYQWRPIGLSDARDGKLVFPGACKTLTNLIHDPVSNNMLAPRPASTFLCAPYTGRNKPPTGIVSAMTVVGTRVFGMIGVQQTFGSTLYDQPFCYDTVTNTFLTINGVTNTNVPLTLNAIGAWTPPCMAVVGNYIVITHAGYTLTHGPVGLINLTTLTYSTGNLMNGTTAVLPSVPVSVAQFYGRAWYAVGNQAYFSDALNPLAQTDAGQLLTLGASTEPITTFVPQGISTATQGILSALIAFKPNSIWQITGDWNYGGSTTGGNLALNELTSSIGCSAPRTAVPTPAGIMFMAVDGIRTIPPQSMAVTEPHPDVVFPFFNCTQPTRACAAYNANTYRISLDTITTTGNPARVEYWLSFKVGRWSGPHTFPANAIVPFGNSFVLGASFAQGQIFQSNSYASTGDSFVEGGNALTFTLTSSLINPDPPMAEKASIEMTVSAVYSMTSYTVQVLDSQGNLINQATLIPANPPALWGGTGIVWGNPGLLWASTPYNTSVSELAFSAPVVFKTCQLALSGSSGLNFRLEGVNFRYEALRYTGNG
jgi:hypothetical protein